MTRTALALALLLALAPAAAQAQTPADPQGSPALTGTLKAILDHGAIRIGYRADAVPFSFTNPGGQPVGFSLDLCHGIAEDAAATLGQDLLEPGAPAWQQGIRIAYIPITADQRLPMVISGAIDLECGSTTANAERAKTVAFSPVFFLAGTRLLVPSESPITSYRALAGKTVALSAGTTNAAVLHRLAPTLTPPIQITEFPSVDAAFNALANNKADATASDDILLAGALAAHPNSKPFAIVGDYLSYEPYAITLRRDDQPFAALITQSFARMAETGTLRARYDRWFIDKLPTGPTLNLPMSPYLTEMYRALGQPD